MGQIQRTELMKVCLTVTGLVTSILMLNYLYAPGKPEANPSAPVPRPEKSAPDLNAIRRAEFRERFHHIAIFLSGTAAAASILGGWFWYGKAASPPTDGWGPYVVGFWTIAPPIYIWFDWVFLCSFIKDDDKGLDRVKTTHDLSRAIWVAFVALLSVLFRVDVLKAIGLSH